MSDVSVEEAFEAIDNNDIETLKAYLTPAQVVGPLLYDQIDAMVGRAVDKDKYDIVAYLINEVCVPARKVINNWHVKHAYAKGHYKIWRFLAEASR